MTTDAVGCAEPDGDARADRHEGRAAVRSPEAVAAAVRADAARIRDRQVTEAIERLGAEREFGDDQRAVLEALAEALVEGVLGEAVEHLRASADRSTARAAVRLFDPEFAAHAVDRGADGSTEESGGESGSDPDPASAPGSTGGTR